MLARLGQNFDQAKRRGYGDAHILVEQLTVSQPEGADFSHQITTGTPGFSNLPMALYLAPAQIEGKWVVLF